jgi:hypothetical protein
MDNRDKRKGGRPNGDCMLTPAREVESRAQHAVELTMKALEQIDAVNGQVVQLEWWPAWPKGAVI